MLPKKKVEIETIWMTIAQFEKALTKIGFNKSSFARAIGFNVRTVSSRGKRYAVPRYVAQLLNLMVETEATPENLKP
jgi:hypothetical protein